MNNKIKLQGELRVGDPVHFPTMAYAINSIFDTDYINFFNSHFVPSVFYRYGLEQYHIWFPLGPNVKPNNIFLNLLSDEDMMISAGLTSGKSITTPTDKKRIVFYGEKQNRVKCYRFIGFFDYAGMKDGFQIWKRTKDKIKVYQ